MVIGGVNSWKKYSQDFTFKYTIQSTIYMTWAMMGNSMGEHYFRNRVEYVVVRFPNQKSKKMQNHAFGTKNTIQKHYQRHKGPVH